MGEIYDFAITALPELQQKNEVKIYPNPAKDYFIIENDKNTDWNVGIYSMYGELVQSTFLAKNTRQEIATTGLSAGLYFVQLSSNKGTFGQKILVRE